MAWVYILKSASGRHYIGSTSDFKRRLNQHNAGLVHSTKRLGLPLTLVVNKEYDTLTEARQVEARLKRWKNSTKAIEYLGKSG